MFEDLWSKGRMMQRWSSLICLFDNFLFTKIRKPNMALSPSGLYPLLVWGFESMERCRATAAPTDVYNIGKIKTKTWPCVIRKILQYWGSIVYLSHIEESKFACSHAFVFKRE